MKSELPYFKIDPIISRALDEDVTDRDISTDVVTIGGEKATVDLIAKQSGIMAGLAVYKRVFELLDKEVQVHVHKKDGQQFNEGEVLAQVRGDAAILLTGERVALNILQRMCGIATATDKIVKLLEGSSIRLMDTRKTTPGLRILEKYAVRVGGGYNHRYNLSDMIMLKDNHIQAAGSVTRAIKQAQSQAPFIKKIEVETETFEMVKEAVEAKADVIMLDNMNFEQMKKAIDFIDGRAIVEASGNMTSDNIAQFKTLGIDYISSGAITHSAGIIDLSMKNFTITNRVNSL